MRDSPQIDLTPARVVEAGHRGDTATVRRALGHEDPAVREPALGAAARAGCLSGTDLATAATDGSPAVRRRAAEEAGRAPGLAAPSVVVGLLGDVDPSVVEMAAWALGEGRAGPGVVRALAAVATGHEEPLCREAAVAALGALGDPAGLPAVLAAMEDKATVRRRAVLALAPFEGPEVDAALERAADDRDWQVRQGALLLGDQPASD